MQFPGRSIESSRQVLSPFSSRPNAMVVHCLRYPLLDWLATDRSLLSNSIRHSLCSCLPSDLHARLPAILMMMDMMGLRKCFLYCCSCCSDVTISLFFHVSLYVFLWRKKPQHRYACNLDWDENALTLTVVRRQKVE